MNLILSGEAKFVQSCVIVCALDCCSLLGAHLADIHLGLAFTTRQDKVTCQAAVNAIRP